MDNRLLTDNEIWLATNYEPNRKEPLTIQDGGRVAKAQLAKDIQFEQALMGEIFKEIENKAHPCDCIDRVRISLDWLDYQALKAKYLKTMEDKRQEVNNAQRVEQAD